MKNVNCTEDTMTDYWVEVSKRAEKTERSKRKKSVEQGDRGRIINNK
jgi:hypothetical protein